MRGPAFAALTAAALLSAPAARAAENDATVPTYHADAARSGHYVFPGLTWANAGDMRRDEAFDGHVPGNVYAQPLYWRPPASERGLVIVATEDNAVAALDAITGSTVWQSRLGPAVARSKLGYGNIDPLGITGTPVIDERGGALYLDAMVDRDSGPRHLVFGLSLADGAVLPGWPVDIADALGALGMSFNAPAQGERGALTLAGDKLYVPYGGHFGEGGDYHGWVVGLSLDRPGVFAAWRTSVSKGGIWAPGGIAFDGSHLFAATGHSPDAAQWGGADAVIRLALDLRWQPVPEDFFAPPDWQQLDPRYVVLAYNNPIVFDMPDGGSRAALLFALDKNGTAYLLDRANLGGIGHPVLATQEVANWANTSPAAWRAGHDMMLAFQATSSSCAGGATEGGVVALRISAGAQLTMERAWCAKLRGRGATIVTTSDATADPIVWVVGAEGDDELHGYRGDDGKALFTSDAVEGFRLRHYATILAAAGRLYVAGDGQVFAFGLVH
jgi:PQQ enzyme repeat